MRVIAFLVVFLMTPPLIKFLEKRNFAVKGREQKRKRHGCQDLAESQSIVAAIIASEIVLYAFLQTQRDSCSNSHDDVCSLSVIGYVDDRKVMGWMVQACGTWHLRQSQSLCLEHMIQTLRFHCLVSVQIPDAIPCTDNCFDDYQLPAIHDQFY